METFKKYSNYLSGFIITTSALLTWFGHDYYNVTGIKQPEFPMNLILWLIPIAKITFSIGIGVLFYYVLEQRKNTNNINSFNEKLDALEKANQLLIAQNNLNYCYISILNYISLERFLDKSIFSRMQYVNNEIGNEAFRKDYENYIKIEQEKIKDFLRLNYKNLTSQEIENIAIYLKIIL